MNRAPAATAGAAAYPGLPELAGTPIL